MFEGLSKLDLNINLQIDVSKIRANDQTIFPAIASPCDFQIANIRNFSKGDLLNMLKLGIET